ncbi:MAG TPA: GNAT family N-acetyltransferase [Gemmatimonadaceae bacterium]
MTALLPQPPFQVRLLIELARPDDAGAIAAIRVRAAEDLTERFGGGHWSSLASEKNVVSGMRTGRVVVARRGATVVGTLSLQTKKPWAIDTTYFTQSSAPWYLTNMAVDPSQQRKGVGRELMVDAERFVREWGGDAIRLDAYDSPAGAGSFYARCGYREVGRVTYRVVPLVYYERVVSEESGVRSEE